MVFVLSPFLNNLAVFFISSQIWLTFACPDSFVNPDMKEMEKRGMRRNSTDGRSQGGWVVDDDGDDWDDADDGW